MEAGAHSPNRAPERLGGLFVAHLLEFAEHDGFAVIFGQGGDGLAHAPNRLKGSEKVMRISRSAVAIPIPGSAVDG